MVDLTGKECCHQFHCRHEHFYYLHTTQAHIAKTTTRKPLPFCTQLANIKCTAIYWIQKVLVSNTTDQTIPQTSWLRMRGDISWHRTMVDLTGKECCHQFHYIIKPLHNKCIMARRCLCRSRGGNFYLFSSNLLGRKWIGTSSRLQPSDTFDNVFHMCNIF